MRRGSARQDDAAGEGHRRGQESFDAGSLFSGPLRPAAPHAPEEPKDPLRDAVRDVLGYERRAFEGPIAVAERELHYWRLSDGTTLWGITAHLVAAFLERAYGWRPPGAPRIVRTRGEVLP